MVIGVALITAGHGNAAGTGTASNPPPAMPWQQRHDTGFFDSSGPDGQRPAAAGRVSAIHGDSLTVTGPGGQTWTINVSSGTTYREERATTTLSDVHVGSMIAVRGTTSGTTVAAIDVAIFMPRSGGIVSAINGQTITVTRFGGSANTITVSESTTYRRADQTASFSDIKRGSEIFAEGTRSGTTLQATAVQIVPPHAAGTVTAMKGDTITILPLAGRMDVTGAGPTAIITSGSTTYRAPGGVTATVKTGDTILAEGTLSTDGKTLQAQRVFVLPAGSAPGQFGRHIFRHNFRGGLIGSAPGDSPATLPGPASAGPNI